MTVFSNRRPEARPSSAKASEPIGVAARWNQADLICRVLRALDIAMQMVYTIAETESEFAGDITRAEGVRELLRGKVVAETAMLLLCVQPIRELDERIRVESERLSALLIPFARHQDVLVAICVDPGLASDRAVAHAILSRLGFPDANVDRLLSKSLSVSPNFGPERLPYRMLEQAWLSRVWSVVKPPASRDAKLVADSMLGRPLDALAASRLDLYAFTHSVMYASDFGMRPIPPIRSLIAIASDADAALAYSLDANDFDLTAELLLTWPMLGLPWSPAATFAFGILADTEDARGFLPGSTFDVRRYSELTADARLRFVGATCYHTMYVMGFLCAAALRQGRSPRISVPFARRSRRSGAALLRFMSAEGQNSCWTEPITVMEPGQQDSLAPLLLTMHLRRARAQGNLRMIRELLEVAVAYDLPASGATSQAAALLMRAQSICI